MNVFADAKGAATGWLDLIGNRPAGAERFNRTGEGLLVAVGAYALLVVIASVTHALVQFGSLPGIEKLVIDLGLNALPMATIFLVILLTVRFLRPSAGLFAMLVPAGWALVFLLAVGLPLSMVAGSNFAFALQGVLGYMLYRLARDVGNFGFGISIGFAVLNIVLLVAVPIGLYMLFVPELPTPD